MSQGSTNDLAAWLSNNDIATVDCGYPDLWGHMRGKRVPVEMFLNSVATGGNLAADAAFAFDLRGQIVETSLITMESGYGDMRVVPDLDTIRSYSPKPGTALVLCDCLDSEEPEAHALSPRGILRKQIERTRSLGFEAVVAPEIEFYLTTPDWQPIQDDTQCYSLLDGHEPSDAIDAVREALLKAGIAVEASHQEYGPGQFEINLAHRPALIAADQALVFKTMIKQIVQDHGYRATFMAKPWAGESGSSMHMNVSLSANGVNAFAERTDDGHLGNSVARRWLSGLMKHASAMTLLCSPNINSYKRIADYSFAPTTSTWSGDNRATAYRTVSDGSAASRVEVRAPGADSNVYIVAAAILAAGNDGLENDYELADPAQGDIYAEGDKHPSLPRTMPDAVKAFESSELAEMLGTDFSKNFVAMVSPEMQAWEEAVTQWEKDRYIEWS